MKTSEIRLSDHFDYGRLLRFTLPSIGMMVLTSIYTIVDGFFVSNYAGKTAFAALNLIYPFIQVLACGGLMFGTGGTAIVSRLLGKQNPVKANKTFSLLVYGSIVLSVILAVFGQIFVPKVAVLLGASPEMLPDCIKYARYLLAALPALFLQFFFQPFMIAAEKPKLGFVITLIAGVANIIGDYVLVGILGMGLDGAAIATVISQILGGGIPLIFFLNKKNGTQLHIGRPTRQMKYLAEAAVNGSSELLSNISASVVSMVYNLQLMKFMGENGVAAYGTIAYVTFIFVAIFVGYSIGIAPVIGYNYGAENDKEQKSLFKKNLSVIGAAALLMLVLSQALAGPLSELFVGYDRELESLTEGAFRIYSISFLICGFNIFASAMFTALSDGVVSAIISFFRTLVCEVACVLIIPAIFGMDSIWWSVIVAECVALCLSAFFLLRLKGKYKYM